MRLRTVLYGTVLSVSGFVLILGLTVYGLLGTETGSRWLFEQVRSRVPGTLTVNSTRGKFLTNFQIENLHYQSESADVQAEAVALSWSPLTLLTGTLELSHLTLRNTEIHLPESHREDGPPTPPDIKLPLSVHLKKLNVHNTTLQWTGENDKHHLHRLSGQIQTSGRRIWLRPLSLRGDGIQGTIKGWFVPGSNYSHDLTISGIYRDLPAGKSLNGTVELRGDQTKTRLNVQMNTPEKLDGTIIARDPLDDLRWSAEINLRDVDIQTYIEDSPVELVDGSISGTGTLHSTDISGSIQTNRPGMQTLDLQFRGERSKDRFRVDEFSLRVRPEHTRNPILDLTMNGQYRLGSEFIQAQGQWDPLVYPPFQENPWLRTRGGVSVSGTRDDYSGTTSARLQTETTGEGHISSRFRGNQTSLNLANFKATTKQGSLRGNGRIQWVPHLDWSFSLEGSEWSPSLLREDLNGRISFRSELKGSYEKEQLRSELTLTNLEGSLQGQSLSGQGTVLVDGSRYRLRDLQLASGDAHLNAQGTLDERWNAEAHLEVTDLERWNLNLDGSGSMHLTIQGPRSIPLVQGQSDLNNLRIADYTVEESRADLHLDFDRERSSTVDLEAQRIRVGERSLDQLTINGNGPITDHVLEISAHHEGQQGSLLLEGELEDERWIGHLKNIHVHSNDFGTWDQQSPSRLVVSDQQLSLAETCLTSGESHLCSSLQGEGEGWGGTLRADSVPASRFNVFLQNDLRLNGTVNLSASGQYSDPRALKLDGDITIDQGSLEYTPDETSDPEVIPLHSTTFRASLNPNKFSAQLNSDFSAYGSVRGEIRIDTPLPMRSLPNRHFEGSLRGTLSKMRLLHLATDAAQWQTGTLKMDVSGSGPLNNPRFQGTAGLKNGQIRLVDPGITVENLHGTLQANGSSLSYSASGESGGGTLALRGSASRSANQSWETNLRITGQNFRTVQTKHLKMNTSPDLDLSVSYPNIVLRGRMKLPKLHLREITALSQDAVTTSDDVHFTDQAEPETARTFSMRAWNFDGLVTIVLGEDVQIREGGFKGGLAGSITLTEKPNQPTLARGELEIVGGSYRAYGRSLSIRSGRIIFSQTAPENPRLEIEAVRKLRDVVAGVRVRGRAENPELTLFSEPPMEESDILSYIVLGKPATGATGDRRQILLQAATAAGFQGGNRLISTLEERLGLETLQLETEGSLEEGSLAIGKYLSPRLYVSYGVGLFDNQDQIKFRYEFDEHWTLEALGGEHTSADLFYRFRP